MNTQVGLIKIKNTSITTECLLMRNLKQHDRGCMSPRGSERVKARVWHLISFYLRAFVGYRLMDREVMKSDVPYSLNSNEV